MSKFFRGWRRKAGCVTLVMTCIFAGAWKRSLTIEDDIWLPSGSDEFFHFVSSSGYLMFERIGPAKEPHFDWQSVFIAEIPPPLGGFDLFDIKSSKAYNPTWFLTAPGCFSMPYWAIIMPLGLLSGCLLLSTPRVAKQVPPQP